MKETAKEVGKKLLEIVRFIFFIPAGFLAGTLVKFPLLLLARIQESMFGLKMDSWGTHLWQTLIFYVVCFLASIYVKPKFLKSKYFILAWSVLLGFNAFIFMSALPNPPYSTPIKIIIDAFAPIGVLIYLIVDKQNDFLKLSKTNNSPKE
ncbi:hypothetical protein [Prochlorococcus marinus]|uniref:Uncharacterized protein n=1 Tax=Prochlorococcus marinus (strain MIT 9301) TaxID=167546 RepID=A3PAJ1_PROM0|nr:hypothetical protein [Prochlorococcus marinus]ABO16766.1 Hypothetical protein P9301_01431 [Prochlorococcus marinus str. MIT 9301]